MGKMHTPALEALLNQTNNADAITEYQLLHNMVHVLGTHFRSTKMQTEITSENVQALLAPHQDKLLPAFAFLPASYDNLDQFIQTSEFMGGVLPMMF